MPGSDKRGRRLTGQELLCRARGIIAEPRPNRTPLCDWPVLRHFAARRAEHGLQNVYPATLMRANLLEADPDLLVECSRCSQVITRGWVHPSVNGHLPSLVTPCHERVEH